MCVDIPVDDASYADAFGYDCAGWNTDANGDGLVDCNIEDTVAIDEFGYTEEQMAEVQAACPFTCDPVCNRDMQDIPAPFLKNCDDLLASEYLIFNGFDSCAVWEYYYYGAPVCSGCECAETPEPSCWALVEFNGVMSNCDDLLASPDLDLTTCDEAEAATGVAGLCTGCVCAPQGTGYGYGYSERKLSLTASPKLSPPAWAAGKLSKSTAHFSLPSGTVH
jgi:hypothetical protein